MARLIVIVVLLVASSFGLNAQNLVLNPSFEQIDTCYRDAFGGDHYIAKNWTDPDDKSSDFFHPCAPNYFFGSVPDNTFGFQYPRTGLSYAGFVFTLDLDPNSQIKAGAEYIQGQLKSPCNPGINTSCGFITAWRATMCAGPTVSPITWALLLQILLPIHPTILVVLFCRNPPYCTAIF